MIDAILFSWLIVALAILLVGIVLTLLSRRIWIKRAVTMAGVGLIILGGVLAIGPTIFLVQAVRFNATPPEHFVVTDVPVEDWSDGKFIADGVEYQMLGLEFNVLLAEDVVGQAAFTYDATGWAHDRQNLNFYPVENSMGFALYWPIGYGNLYCEAEQAEAVAQYYQSDAAGRAYYLKCNGLHPVDDAAALALQDYLSQQSWGEGLPFSLDAQSEVEGFDLLETSGDGLFVLEEYPFLVFDDQVYFAPNSFDTIYLVPEALGEHLLALCQ